jgi:hypothetical protein
LKNIEQFFNLQDETCTMNIHGTLF